MEFNSGFKGLIAA